MICGFLPTAAAEALERLTTANPKSDLSFNGSEFAATTPSEVSLRLGCAAATGVESANFAVDKLGTEALALTCSLSEVFASSWSSDLEAFGVSFRKIENYFFVTSFWIAKVPFII